MPPNIIRTLLLSLTIIAVAACATTSVQRSYITIRQPESLIAVDSGEIFEVSPGDSLKIIETTSCAKGKGVCWKVSSTKTGKIGLVNAELIQEQQEVYIEEDGRIFANNTFQSKRPEVTININPELKYVGFISQRGNRQTSDYYIFINPMNINNENKVKFGGNIIFRKADTAFTSELYHNVKDKLYAGVEQYAKKNFQYYIKKIYSPQNAVVPKYLFEKGGYIVPFCIIGKPIGRTVGNRNDMMIEFGYYENINEYGFSCSTFATNGKTLNEDEIKYIEEFNERAKSAFEIIYSQ